MARGEGQVAFADVSLAGTRVPLDFNLEQYLLNSIVVGTPVTRYGRTWRITRTERDGQIVSARMGYDRNAGTETWNEAAQDFTDQVIREGTASPFALDLTNGRLAFQLRGQDIKPDTFTWNFQALLNAGARLRQLGVHWRVRKELVGEDWETFKDRAERVNQLDFTLYVPNPHYGKRTRIKSVISDANAHMTRVVITAAKDDLAGIDVNAVFVQQAVEHVQEKYGKFRATAEVPIDGVIETERWSSDKQGAPLTTAVPVNPDTGEVNPADLARELETTTIEDEDGDDG